MLTEIQVADLLKPIIEGFKKIDSKLMKKKLYSSELPDFHPYYKTACEYYERIKIHSEIGTFPEKLFHEHSPNMTDKEFKYLKGNYKQITLPVYTDYISTITRPFSDGNWGLEFAEDDESYIAAEQTFQEYVENEIDHFDSLENYFKNIIPHVKTKDANGVICIKPLKFDLIEDDADPGKLIQDTGKLYKPQPVYYNIYQVMSEPEYDSEYFIIHLEDKSSVNYRKNGERIGHIFEVIDKENIWRYEQVGNFTDYKFNLSLYFHHGWGRVPAKRLGGIPQLAGKGVLWQSPFMASTDTLDLALMNANYLQVSLANTMFPYRVMIGNKCTYQYKDDGGQVFTCDNGKIYSNNRLIDCPNCGGSGLRDRVSPLGVLLLNPSDMISEGDAKFSGKPMEYISPSTESVKFIWEKVEADLEKGAQILHLHTTGSQMKGSANITATELGLDVKALYAFVKSISDQMFSLFEFMLDAIGWQRYGEKYKRPLLTYPVTFDFNTEEDYLRQITAAQAAQVPAFVIHSIIYKYLQTLYYNEKQTANVFSLIVNTDRLLVLTYDDVISKYNLGLADKWEVILHDSAIELVNELVLEDEKFFDKKLVDQKNALIERAKSKVLTLVKPVVAATNTVVADIIKEEPIEEAA